MVRFGSTLGGSLGRVLLFEDNLQAGDPSYDFLRNRFLGVDEVLPRFITKQVLEQI